MAAQPGVDIRPFPSSVRIGAIDYDVVLVDGLEGDDHVALNGHIVYNANQIRVEADMTMTSTFATIWHEVLHGLLEQAGIEAHDERSIIALGYGITAVLRDNPMMRQPPR